LRTAGFQIEQPNLARIMAEHARKRAPQPRMWVDIVRQSVEPIIVCSKASTRLHVTLVHHPVDGTGWLQPRCRLGEADAPIAAISASSRPAWSGIAFDHVNQHLERVVDALLPQHGRRGDIGVRVEAISCAPIAAAIFGRVLDGAAELATPVVL